MEKNNTTPQLDKDEMRLVKEEVLREKAEQLGVDDSNMTKTGVIDAICEKVNTPENAHPVGLKPSKPKKQKEPKQKTKTNFKKPLIIAGVTIAIIVACVIGYIVKAGTYDTHFLPHTTVNGVDISEMTVDEAFNAITKDTSDITVTIKDKNGDTTITGEDIGMVSDKESIQGIKDGQNKWNWLPSLIGNAGASNVGTVYDEDKLKLAVKDLDCVSGKDRTDPVNTTVSYDSTAQSFKASGEKDGDVVAEETMLEEVKKAVDAHGGTIDTSNFFSKPKYTSDCQEVQTVLTTLNNYLSKKITYNIDMIDDAVSLDKDTIATFVGANPDDMTVKFNDDAISAWLRNIGKEYDTAGTTRSYTTAYGKSVTVSGGSSTYGWITDEKGMFEVVKNNLTSADMVIDQDFKYEQTADGPKGGAEWGSNYVDLDLDQQKVRYIQNNQVVFEAVTVTGTNTDKKRTPEGIWSILEKRTNYTMTGEIDPTTGQPEYTTPCDYFNRFTWSGCAFHDATWRSDWSSTAWLNGNGSHGCANMKWSDVKELTSLISVGTPVIVHM